MDGFTVLALVVPEIMDAGGGLADVACDRVVVGVLGGIDVVDVVDVTYEDPLESVVEYTTTDDDTVPEV